MINDLFVEVKKVESLKGKEGLSTNHFHQIPGEIRIRDVKTREPLVIVTKADFNVNPFERACQNIKYVEAERASGLVNTSKTFGFQPRTPLRLRDYCCSSDMAVKQASIHTQMAAGAILAEDAYMEHVPLVYGAHKKKAEEKIKDQWRMHGGIFTSGIVNKNNQLRYHIDSQNMEDCWSVMLVMKRGVEGGHLIIPELEVELHLPHGSLAIFNGQRFWHAVTPWKKTQFNGHRYSIVWYTMEEMCKCLTPKEELSRSQKARTELEFRRLEKTKEKENE